MDATNFGMWLRSMQRTDQEFVLTNPGERATQERHARWFAHNRRRDLCILRDGGTQRMVWMTYLLAHRRVATNFDTAVVSRRFLAAMRKLLQGRCNAGAGSAIIDK